MPAEIASLPNSALDKSAEYLATTFPIGARGQTPKLGLLATSLVADVLSRRHSNVTSRIAFNTLDSYQDREGQLSPLLEAHKKLAIRVDNAWFDSEAENQLALFSQIDRLVELDCIRPERTEVFVCGDECLRVEMLADVMTMPEGRIYRKHDNGDLVCVVCNEVARQKEIDALVMYFPDVIETPTVYPNVMQADFDELTRRHLGARMLVSRSRQTGVTYVADGQSFNLDIDFFWMNFLNTISEGYEGVALIGSNHVRRHLATIAALCLAKNSSDGLSPQVKIIMPSYITKAEGFDAFTNGGYTEESDPNALRLLILASMSWMKDSKWGASLYPYIKRRLKSIDWTNNTATTVFDLQELYADCEQIRGGAIAKGLKTPTDETKFNMRGAVIGS